MPSMRKKDVVIIAGFVGALAVVLFHVWFYWFSGIKRPPPLVSSAEKLRHAKERINGRIGLWEKYMREGSLSEEEFRNNVYVNQYLQTRDYLNSISTLEAPHVVALVLLHKTYQEGGINEEWLSLTVEWLAIDTRVTGICVKSKDAPSGENKLTLWPLETYWSRPDNIEALEACAFQDAGSRVVIGSNWSTRRTDDDLYPILVMPKDILEGQTLYAVYDENGRVSNYVEMYITPSARQYIEDYVKDIEDKQPGNDP